MGVTDDRDDPRLKNVGPDGMQEAYLVLSDEERKKGFVRPLRRSYIHVGRAICGKQNDELYQRRLLDDDLPSEDVVAYGCSALPGHEDECASWMPLTRKQLHQHGESGMIDGCGVETTMGLALCETYARDPKFYGGTYCVRCKTHPRVGEYGEFVWAEDGTRVGT